MPGTITFEATDPEEKEGLTASADLSQFQDEGDDVFGITEKIPGFGPVNKIIGELDGVPKRVKLWLEANDNAALRAKIRTWTTLRRATGTLTVTQRGYTDSWENVFIERVAIPDSLINGAAAVMHVEFNMAGEEQD